MGQYYKPVILKDNKKTVEAFMYSHDYGNGLKLMEHSYIDNTFVEAFETLIEGNPQRVVWAGDYADEDKGMATNVYSRCKDSLLASPSGKVKASSKFIINHSKKQFVDKDRVPEMSADWADGMKIHPLPLLTCEGNGRGGGDFRGEEKNLVGAWARDVISIDKVVPDGFNEITFDLDE